MTTIVTILTEGYADWEVALLNATARGYYGARTRFATPGGRTVRSSGGLSVTPDLALEDLVLTDVDAVLVCGGTIWRQPDAPDLGDLLRRARADGKVVGAICDGTLAAARAGLLDAIPHTGNGVGTLDDSGYAGAAHYRDVPVAVAASGVITAPGTAPISFMAEVLGALGLADDDLFVYLDMHAAEHRAVN